MSVHCLMIKKGDIATLSQVMLSFHRETPFSTSQVGSSPTRSYPLVICYRAIENGQFIVDFPIKEMYLFHSYVNILRRVCVLISTCSSQHCFEDKRIPYPNLPQFLTGSVYQIVSQQVLHNLDFDLMIPQPSHHSCHQKTNSLDAVGGH